MLWTLAITQISEEQHLIVDEFGLSRAVRRASIDDYFAGVSGSTEILGAGD